MEPRLTIIDKNTMPQYAVGSPILLEACALYFDNVDKQCIAQLKLKNLDNRVIVALMVELVCFDVFGHEIEKRHYQYLHLSVKQGTSFGDRNAIPLKQGDIKNYHVCLKAVSFEDGMVIEPISPMVYQPLPEAKSLNLQSGLLEQYKRDLTKRDIQTTVKHYTQNSAGLWQCVCGSWQKEGTTCLACHASQADLIDAFSLKALAENLNVYREEQEAARKDSILADAKQRIEKTDVEECAYAIELLESIPDWKEANELIPVCRQRIEEIIERQEAEKHSREQEEELKRRQLKKQARIKSIKRILLTLTITTAIFYFVRIVIPNRKYDMAKDLMNEEKYEQALEMFSEIKSHKDSVLCASLCRKEIKKQTLYENFTFTPGMYMWNVEKDDDIEFLPVEKVYSMKDCPQNAVYYPVLRIKNKTKSTQNAKIDVTYDGKTWTWKNVEITASSTMSYYLDEWSIDKHTLIWYVDDIEVARMMYDITAE